MIMETRIRDGMDYLAEYTYRFKCGVWRDIKNLKMIIKKDSRGTGTRPWIRKGRPILIE